MKTKEFAIRFVLYLTILFSLLFTLPYFAFNSSRIEQSIEFVGKFGAFFAFAAIIFIVAIKDRIKEIKKQERNKTIKFSLFTIFGIIIGHLITYYRFFHLNSILFANLLRYGIISFILIGVPLFFAFFNLKYKKFKKEIGMFAAILLFSAIIWETRYLLGWEAEMGGFAGQIVVFLLGLTFTNVEFITGQIPGIRLEDFAVGVTTGCSGIEGIALFTVTYIFLSVLDWKKLNKKKVGIFFVLGVLGMYLVNALRIYTLMIVGAFWSPELAIGIFHNNLGWIFFLVYYFTFIWYVYPKIKEK